MPAYARFYIEDFVRADPTAIIGVLQSRYAHDGFASQYTQQTKSWEALLPLLQTEIQHLLAACPQVARWGVLIEFPLYRLRRRIDLVLLAGSTVIVLEAKAGVDAFRAEDERQVEDYALDLRDFHAASRECSLVPVLWCTAASQSEPSVADSNEQVTRVRKVGKNQLRTLLGTLVPRGPHSQISLELWDEAPYQPVPTIIQAATSIFAGHDVRDLARADASNLALSAKRIVEIIAEVKRAARKAVVFLTGVPGAGKTLAGLQVVHDAISTGTEERGDIVYLSGNTPLVVVLREALARDTVARARVTDKPTTLANARRLIRTRIQHITDFLRSYLVGTPDMPHEHAIVFDEAQRAWDAKHGAEKFDRPKSEPSLLLEIMGRRADWCACVCLVGGGQEINTGEEGMKGWGDALRAIPPDELKRWEVYGPDDVFLGGASTGGLALGDLPASVATRREPDLHLSVSLRSYRSPVLSEWVTSVLEGDLSDAERNALRLGDYPVVLTRSLTRMKHWLQDKGRGERRYGLLASSGARRLRAEGLGVLLGAADGDAIAQWYLNQRDDIRSSYFLEVPANEYACQGLELDYAGICWGGDLVYSRQSHAWRYRSLSGTAWGEVRSEVGQRYLLNKYRVLMTRAREGLVIWVPPGDDSDRTRSPAELDATAEFLMAAGAQSLDTVILQ